MKTHARVKPMVLILQYMIQSSKQKENFLDESIKLKLIFFAFNFPQYLMISFTY